LTQGIILDEELAFLRTLEKGIKEFNSKTTSLGVGAVVPRELAFLLYDSCGFPLDLTQVMAEERGWTVDLDGFQQLMNEQKERSRKKSSGSGDKIILQAEQTDFIAKTISASPTDDSAKYSWVSMGTGKPIKAKVLAVWTGKEFSLLPLILMAPWVSCLIGQTFTPKKEAKSSILVPFPPPTHPLT